MRRTRRYIDHSYELASFKLAPMHNTYSILIRHVHEYGNPRNKHVHISRRYAGDYGENDGVGELEKMTEICLKKNLLGNVVLGF